MSTHHRTDLEQALDSLSLPKDGEDYDEGSSTNQDISTNGGSERDAPKAKKTKDDKLVVYSRAIAIATLLLSAFTIATLTYFVVANNQEESFKADFQATANKVVKVTAKSASNMFLSIESLATLFPSAAHQSNATMPFITVDDFEQFGRNTRALSKASAIAFSPILHSSSDLAAWNSYSVDHTKWILHTGTDSALDRNRSAIKEFVYKVDRNGKQVPESGKGLFSPLWQITPIPDDTAIFNYNLASNTIFAELLNYVTRNGKSVLSVPADVQSIFGVNNNSTSGPVSVIMEPVFEGSERMTATDRRVVGTISALVSWKDFFTDILPESKTGIIIVAESCGTNNTFLVTGETAEALGVGDLHNRLFDDMEVRSAFVDFDPDNTIGHCNHNLHIFPTDSMRSQYITHTPIRYAAVVSLMFICTGIMFLLYDRLVSKRQDNLERASSKLNAIVQELYPGNIAARLFHPKKKAEPTFGFKKNKASTENEEQVGESSPTNIAELFPAATVLFGDIAGFTAWSSMREPQHVFTLLESVFQAFDLIAKKHGIFKVETIGDCYVAVCGVPKPSHSHAVHMVRFARAARTKFNTIVHELSLSLGPDTSELGMRIGIHSGPVIAGVLRADRARFQLFGDTVNTASRIESSGMRDRIHLSEQTADVLMNLGKGNWIIRRDDAVEAKGKGRLTTYWLKLNQSMAEKSSSFGSSSCDTSTGDSSDQDEVEEIAKPVVSQTPFKDDTNPPERSKSKHDRIQKLVDWNTDLLLGMIQKIAARRPRTERRSSNSRDHKPPLLDMSCLVVDEVAEIIDLPHDVLRSTNDKVKFDSRVVSQLRAFVAKIASMYNDNPFHNFEHASHVTMSITKLLARINTTNASVTCSMEAPGRGCVIAADPMTQFSIVLAALVHDLDHPGVSNAQLMKENKALSKVYQNRSVAEQNSVDLAWRTLFRPEYAQLRETLFPTIANLGQFRQILVNAVIATDIFDKDLGVARKLRWDQAFDMATNVPNDTDNAPSREAMNRKATVIIETSIQASDVAHTMQHWYVYQKWNQRLFNEMYQAYRDGRSDHNPADGWYDGELGFFDHYIIPLAQKLKDCGAFGVSGDEYLNYATQNRSEWAVKGRANVERYLFEFDNGVE